MWECVYRHTRCSATACEAFWSLMYNAIYKCIRTMHKFNVMHKVDSSHRGGPHVFPFARLW